MPATRASMPGPRCTSNTATRTLGTGAAGAAGGGAPMGVGAGDVGAADVGAGLVGAGVVGGGDCAAAIDGQSDAITASGANDRAAFIAVDLGAGVEVPRAR